MRIQFSWAIPRLPSECAICGCRFDLSNALSCKKGGFATMRHNEAERGCRDVRVEPSLLELNSDRLNQQANRK